LAFDSFLELEPADQESALLVAAERSGRAPHLLEKDVWAVWTLNALFRSKFGRHLVFKRVTSLS
jgi:predicted nucleotidyltransferase component of viral defense system